MNFKGRDLISINDLSKEEILHILKTAERLEQAGNAKLMQGKVLGSLFFEPSTRTRLSTEAAMERLGGKVIGFADEEVTSTKKGESLYDTIKIVQSYCDILAIRHPLEGSARLAAEASDVPVINCGDGANQHPTQTLLDLYTIKKSQGRLHNLRIAMVGDLKYGRTVHSLTYALQHFNADIHFVSPRSLRIPLHMVEELQKRKAKFSEHLDINEVIHRVDILYSTRIQKERFPTLTEYEKVKNAYIITKDTLRNVRKNFKIMHPLPRVNEISKEIDDTPYALYFEQAANGIPVRQAIMALLTGALQ